MIRDKKISQSSSRINVPRWPVKKSRESQAVVGNHLKGKLGAGVGLVRSGEWGENWSVEENDY
jgi:hypothetical protein